MSDPSVFHLITRFLNGGAEAIVKHTVTGLTDYNFTVGHGASFERDQVELLEQQGIETYCEPLLRHYNPITAVPAVFSLATYIRRQEFDIVHTHSTEAGIVGRAAAALAGVDAIVHTVHGVPFSDDRNTVLNRFVLACERWAAPRTDRILSNADIITEAYLERGIGTVSQYETVYSGIRIDDFTDVTPASLPGERPRILMVSRLVEGKGFDVLLDAVSSLDTTASVCIAGDGPLEASLKEDIQRRGLDGSVHLLGYRSDIPNVMAASDVLVLPSFREGTPRVITEAMASGLPVVATDIAGIPEQVTAGECGFLVPTGDPVAVAARLNELLANADRREQMGQAAKDRVTQFSLENMLSDIDSVYRTLLSEREPPV